MENVVYRVILLNSLHVALFIITCYLNLYTFFQKQESRVCLRYIGLSMPSLCVYNTLATMKLQNFTNDHCFIIVAVVIWPKYYRYGVKHYIINQALTVRLHRSSHRSVNALIVCLRNIGLLMPSLCVYET